MHHLRALPLALLAVALCAATVFAAPDKPGKKPANKASNNKGKIEGTKWSSEATTVKDIPIAAGTLKLEFRKDGTMKYLTPTGTYTGKYSLGEGDSVTFNFDTKLAGRKEHTEKIVIKEGRLTMSDSDGTTVTFAKQK
jgi:hypothetical protein